MVSVCLERNITEGSTNNSANEVASVVQTHHDATVCWMRHLDGVCLRAGPEHDGSNPQYDATCDHIAAPEGGSLDHGADHNDDVCDEHASTASEIVRQWAGDE